ncbi:MAG: hypothetical protein AUK28_06095 [Desulfobacterales bacterium CG2_30_60_27]|nr:MAG: hypothetical protein AUK28_06095 [Desulfobacterales bacterium CG2_30_60_27]
MAENIFIVVIVLICLLLLVRHFFRQVSGKGCGCGTGTDQTPLQRDLPDLRADRPAPPSLKATPPPKPGARDSG